MGQDRLTWLLPAMAAGEIATGIALLLAPEFVVRLLAGAEVTGLGVSVSRFAGIALIGLGAACWPGPAALGMIMYTTMAAIGLAVLGISGQWSGVLLWPAVAAHAVLAVLLIRGRLSARNART